MVMSNYPVVRFLQALRFWRGRDDGNQEPASLNHHNPKAEADANIQHQLNTSYGYFLPPC